MKISKGTHKPFRFPSFTFRRAIKGFVQLNGDFTYTIEKQGDTNKLIGLSDSFSHHSNSVRLGWRYYHDKLEIMVIVYSNGKRQIKHLAFAKSDTTYSFSIEIKEDEYVVSFGSDQMRVKRTSKWRFWRYFLGPYFGGTTKAPKDFDITYGYYYE